jgi:hypothetical protein
MAVTTWNIAPDYDQWGSDTWWKCDEWIAWHKRLKEHFGSERAKLIFNYAYAQGSEFSGHRDCRTFNSAFRKYAREEGLDTYASVTIPILPQILNLTGSGLELLDDTSNVVSGIGESIGSIFGGNGKTLKVIIYGALGLSVGYLMYRGYKLVNK